MKKIVVLLTLFLIISHLLFGQSIKKVKITDILKMADITTSPLVINFWATWCGPCVRELTYFDSIIAAKNLPVKLILVSLDFPESYPKKLAAFVQKQGYKGEVVFLAEANADVFISTIEKKWNGAIPASIFVNHAINHYQMFNMQLTRQRFAMELDRLVKKI